MDKMTIKIKDVAGCECLVIPASGQEVYEKAADALRDGKRVELSFEQMRVITSAPLNYAVGQLFNGEFSEEFLKEHLSFTGMNGCDKYLIDAVIENAKRYYSANGNVQDLKGKGQNEYQTRTKN